VKYLEKHHAEERDPAFEERGCCPKSIGQDSHEPCEGQDCGRSGRCAVGQSGVAIFHKARSFFRRKRYCERGALTEFCRIDGENRGGINVVQKLLLENGEVAVFKPATGEPLRENITPGEVSDIEKARQLFRDAGLAFPTIPEELAAQLKELGPWLFSTRPIRVTPYNLEYYVHEAERIRVKDYVALCHDGHGINSYAIHYYLVHGSLRMFLQLGWGGVYTNAKAAAALIRDCFSVADQIVTEAPKVGRFLAGERLTIVGSQFYGSYWLQPGEGRRRKDADREDHLNLKPLDALTEVLGWLKHYRGEKLSKRGTRIKIGTSKERN